MIESTEEKDNQVLTTLNYMISDGVDLNCETKNGCTLLHYAIGIGCSLKVIEILIESGLDVNYAAKDGWTPLFYAIDRKNKNAIKLLITNGANVKHIAKDGYTSLHAAAAVACDNDIFEILFNEGVGSNINCKSLHGMSPLYLAITYGCSKAVIENLIVHGADVNFTDRGYGISPLIAAISKGYIKEVVKLLIVNGADINHKDNTGRTALDYAMSKGDSEILAVLENANQNSYDYEVSTDFMLAIASLSKIVAKNDEEIFLTKNKQKFIGLLSDMFPQNNEFYLKLKKAVSCDFAELILNVSNSDYDKRRKVLEEATEMIIYKTELNTEDAILIVKLVAFSLDCDLEV